MVFLKEFFDKIDNEKKTADDENYPEGKELKEEDSISSVSKQIYIGGSYFSLL